MITKYFINKNIKELDIELHGYILKEVKTVISGSLTYNGKEYVYMLIYTLK